MKMTPTLDKLVVLKFTRDGKTERIRIIRRISGNWRDIAALICDDPNKANSLEQKYSNPTDCLRQLFQDNFINKKPADYTRDWEGIIELLKDINQETLAEEVEHGLKTCDILCAV